MKRRLIRLLLCAALLVCLLLPASLAREAEEAGPIVVSMGDSYSSGEGVEPFYGQDNLLRMFDQDYMAHRSEKSWPGQLYVQGLTGPLSQYPDTHWFFVAASGAKVIHLYDRQPSFYQPSIFWEAPIQTDIDNQLAILDRLGDRVDIVTLTLGGNDADFVGVVSEAAGEFTLFNTHTEKLREKLTGVWGHFWEKNGIRESLRDAYLNIARLTGYDDAAHTGGAHIIVAGYPRLLHEAGLLKGDAFFSRAEVRFLNENVDAFNREIEALVKECRDTRGLDIEFVDVAEAFSGHEAYSDDPWIWPVIPYQKDHDLGYVPKLTGDDKRLASSYSLHPNEKGTEAYARCVQQAIHRYYAMKDKTPDDFLLARLYAMASNQHVLPTRPIPALRRDTYDSVPGWTEKDLDGLLSASIEDLDGDGEKELLTVSLHTENPDGNSPLTGVILRVYEMNPRTLAVEQRTEKAVPASGSFLKTQLLSEQLNCLTVTRNGQRLIVLDDCRASNDKEVTLAAYRYDGEFLTYAGGAGYVETGMGDTRVYVADGEPAGPLSCMAEGFGWGLITDLETVGSQTACYERFQSLLFDFFGLNGDDQRLRVNQSLPYGPDYARAYNDLIRLTAREVYVDDTQNVLHIASVYNCHYLDDAPVDGSAWHLYFSDDQGLLDRYRDETGGRPCAD